MLGRRLTRRAFLGAVSAAALGCTVITSGSYRSFMGQTPPSLEAPDATWLNGDPVDWPDLKGKVVLVTFSFLR